MTIEPNLLEAKLISLLNNLTIKINDDLTLKYCNAKSSIFHYYKFNKLMRVNIEHISPIRLSHHVYFSDITTIIKPILETHLNIEIREIAHEHIW